MRDQDGAAPLPAAAIQHPFQMAIALSFGAAIALGLSRFSYGLLLPPMRADLEWSYLLAGGLNTANAVGYLLGVLLTPRTLRAVGTRGLLIWGAALSSLFMFLPGLTVNPHVLLALRLLSGIASAFVFIAGGILAARLASLHGKNSGLILGIYYGGTGIGIMLSALLIPLAMGWADAQGHLHSWRIAWWVLALACLIAAVIAALPSRRIGEPDIATEADGKFALRDFTFGLAGYLMFGVGYIGYMTFVAALLKEQGLSDVTINAFYFMLGAAVLVSSRIWAGLLDRYKGGQPLAVLNTILGCACILPVVTTNLILIFMSGLVFGGVFLSVVTSTTALVRHNLPQSAWPAAISAFTGAFALGQIIGPAAVGGIADTPAGLKLGLALSAATLFIGALLALRQKELAASPAHSRQRE